ncbi:unnamed protein product [Urochloa humidicola]
MVISIRVIVGIIGSAVCVLLYAVPILTFKRVIREASVGEFSCIPYIITLFSALTWGWYGFPVVSCGWKNLSVSGTCCIGVLFEISFVSIYIWFAPREKKKFVTLMVSLVLAILCAIVFFSSYIFHTHHVRKLFVGSIGIVTSMSMLSSPLVAVVVAHSLALPSPSQVAPTVPRRPRSRTPSRAGPVVVVSCWSLLPPSLVLPNEACRRSRPSSSGEEQWLAVILRPKGGAARHPTPTLPPTSRARRPSGGRARSKPTPPSSSTPAKALPPEKASIGLPQWSPEDIDITRRFASTSRIYSAGCRLRIAAGASLACEKPSRSSSSSSAARRQNSDHHRIAPPLVRTP